MGDGFSSACFAPFGNLYLHTSGRVTACCVSTHVLGEIAEQSLLDIWQGARAEALRAALAADDLSLGCSFCQWEASGEPGTPVFAREFDVLAVDGQVPAWPRRLEFEISNTCNLECVMCTGELSSMIRSRREHRPPMAKVYGDRFFTELREFLPHLDSAGFLGGEPFLAAETFRVWDLMVELGLETPCSVVTNGTQWNARVERVLEALPMSVTVSLDGATADTFEAIRVGASFDQVMANLARFRDRTAARGTELRLAFCLMRSNWHELADVLLLGDSLDARVRVNTVTDPVHGLAQLPPDELTPVVAALEQRAEDVEIRLGRNRDVWTAELARLRGWLAASSTTVRVNGVSAGSLYLLDTRPGTLPTDLRSSVDPLGPAVTVDEATVLIQEDLPGGTISVLRCDDEDLVVGVDGDDFLGVPAAQCVGRPFAELVHALQDAHGEHVHPLDTLVLGSGVLRRAIHRDGDGTATYLSGYGFASPLGSITVAGRCLDPPPWATAETGAAAPPG